MTDAFTRIIGPINLKILSCILFEKNFIYDLSKPSSIIAAPIGKILLSKLKKPKSSVDKASPNFNVATKEQSIEKAITRNVLLT